MTINTILLDLPTKIKGHTVKNEDDSYSIFLNAKMTQDQIEKTYEHEIAHIENEDFKKDQVQRIETYAHDVRR